MLFLISLRRPILRLRPLKDLDTVLRSQSTHQLRRNRNEEALMKRLVTCSALLIVIGCLAAARSNGQQIFLFSQSSCDQPGVDCESSLESSGGIIWGYSATEVDYWTSHDYIAYVDSELSQNGALLDTEWDEEDIIAEVQTSATAYPETLYTERGYHQGI